MLTYASLVKKYGKGTVIKSSKPVTVTASLSVVKAGASNKLISAANTVTKVANSGVMAIKFVLTTAGPNLNNQFFVESELSDPAVYCSPIGEPIDWDHNQDFMAICGDITASEYVPSNGADPGYIQCRGIIFSDIYPDIAEKVQRGAGRWAGISMEAMPNPLEQVGKYLVVHCPTFVGGALTRTPACPAAKINEVDGTPIYNKKGDFIVTMKRSLDILF